MSKYTTEVRFICEVNSGLTESVGESSILDVIKNSREKIFNFTYPIFDKSYRTVLETKILMHYYTREIAFETVGLWKLKLNTKLNEIMPYYNKLYESELLKFDPLKDYELNRTHLTTNTGEKKDTGTSSSTTTGNTFSDSSDEYQNTTTVTEDSKSTSNSSETNNNREDTTNLQINERTEIIDNNVINTNEKQNSHKDMYSETPQGNITNLEQGKYLTNARLTEDKETDRNENTNRGENRVTTDGRDEKHTDINGKSDFNSTVNNESNNNLRDNSNRTITNSTNNSSDTNQLNTNDSTSFSTEDYVENVKGKVGGVTYSDMLLKFRETFLNIDMMIIEELSDLFFTLW